MHMYVFCTIALQRLSTGALNNNRGSEGMSISSAGALAASVEPEHKSKHPNRFKFAPVMRRMHKEVKKLKKQSKSASLTEALNTRSSLFGYDHPMGQSDVLGDELGATKSDSSSGSDDGLVYDEAFNSGNLTTVIGLMSMVELNAYSHAHVVVLLW